MNDAVVQEIDRWFRENPQEERRYVFPLSPSSLVMDVGAYDGVWGKGIFDRYCCKILAFEPSPSLFQKTCNTLNGTGAIAYPIALGGSSKELTLNETEDASSSYRTTATSTPIQVQQIDVELFFRQEQLAQVDLVKINIEGAEYELLERMIEADLVKRCRYMLVQFHPWVDNHPTRKKNIATSLQKTHRCAFCYQYVWELWERC